MRQSDQELRLFEAKMAAFRSWKLSKRVTEVEMFIYDTLLLLKAALAINLAVAILFVFIVIIS